MTAREPRSRERAWDELARRRFDLLVIGGGIVGAGVAREATRAGLAVALVDKGDFGGATSSASTKLVHGGLRYLRLGDLGLVRESHSERRALMRDVAPHLVRPFPFLVPIYREGPYRAATVQAGIWLYSALAREAPRRLVKPRRAADVVPSLRLDGLRGFAVYRDSWTHDSRLCLANVRGAADAGATVLNYAEVTALRTARGRVEGADVADRLGRGSASVFARAVVNATGPWVDPVRRLEDPRATRSSHLSKGVHVTLPLGTPWAAALTIPQDGVRVSFAVPWHGMLLLGTTDTLYDGAADDVRATEEDVDAILSEAAVALDSDVVRRERVRATFAGLRVLPGLGAETAGARRETVLLRGPGGMLSVAGGKLSTYRRIALAVLEALRGDLGLHRIDHGPAPLPGAVELAEATERIARRFPALEPSARSHLAQLYGGLAEEVLAPADEEAGLLRPLHPDAPDVAAQAVYAAGSEWACLPDDFLRRRTTLALRGLAVPAVVSSVRDLFARGAAERAVPPAATPPNRTSG